MAASKKDVAKQQVKEDREKVREMYLSGKTVKEIAKETYFSSSYCYAMVRDLAKEKNLAKKAKRAPLNEAMIQEPVTRIPPHSCGGGIATPLIDKMCEMSTLNNRRW